MSQLTKGLQHRLMYLENKQGNGDIARIGWVTFSRTARTIYYRGRSFIRMKGGGISGNYLCEQSGEEFWISGIKKKGSNVHWAEKIDVVIDDDALDEYTAIKQPS